MMRRAFLKTGVGGTALSLAQVVPTPTNSRASGGVTDPGIVVIGADGSVPSKPIVDKYIAAAADVWFYLLNLPEFSADLEFLDSDPRIKLAKTVADIRAHKQAGTISMVIGWQNSAALEEGPGNDWRNSRPPRTKLREYYELGQAPGRYRPYRDRHRFHQRHRSGRSCSVIPISSRNDVQADADY